MGYKDIRFHGFFIHDDAAYERAQSVIRNEMAERQQQRDGSNFYQPNRDFKKSVENFAIEIQSFDRELHTLLQQGGKIGENEIRIMDRSERLYAEAIGQTSERTPLRLSYLDAGLAVHGQGLSRTQKLKLEVGVEPSGNSYPSDEVRFRL